MNSISLKWPSSIILSASSMTITSIKGRVSFKNLLPLSSSNSHNLPGVAMIIAGSLLNSLSYFWIDIPPTNGHT